MKKKLSYIIPSVILAAAAMAGCKLDSKVYNQVTPDQFFKTPQQVTAFVAQAYTPMTNIPFGGTFNVN